MFSILGFSLVISPIASYYLVPANGQLVKVIFTEML